MREYSFPYREQKGRDLPNCIEHGDILSPRWAFFKYCSTSELPDSDQRRGKTDYVQQGPKVQGFHNLS